MAKMLDVLEAFLNLHGHTYMRLDGSTKPEARQVGSWNVLAWHGMLRGGDVQG